MASSRRRFLRRWGGRAVGLTITGLGLYVVAPSLVTMFAAWPQLAQVDVPWFFVLGGLQFGRLVALWWLTKLALAPGWRRRSTARWERCARRQRTSGRMGNDGDCTTGRERRSEGPSRWRRRRGDGPGQGAHRLRPATQGCRLGPDRHRPAQQRRPVPPASPHDPCPAHRTASGQTAPARIDRLRGPRRRHRRDRGDPHSPGRGCSLRPVAGSAGSCTSSGRG